MLAPYENLCWVSQAKLAQEIGRSQSTISRHMDLLFKIGALVRIPGCASMGTIKEYLYKRFKYKFSYLSTDKSGKHSYKMNLFRLNHEWEEFTPGVVCLSDATRRIIAETKSTWGERGKQARPSVHDSIPASTLPAVHDSKLVCTSEGGVEPWCTDVESHPFADKKPPLEEVWGGEPPCSPADPPTFREEDYTSCMVEGIALASTPTHGLLNGYAVDSAKGGLRPPGVGVEGVASERADGGVTCPPGRLPTAPVAFQIENPTPATPAAPVAPRASGRPSLASQRSAPPDRPVEVFDQPDGSYQPDDIDELLDQFENLD
jgi:hypothetical protein